MNNNTKKGTATKNHSYNVYFIYLLHCYLTGYFNYMRTILEAKVPSNLEKSATPPTPQAASIFSLIMSPIIIATEAREKAFRSVNNTCK